MQQFIAKFKDQIQGVMYGFDRVLFRGSLRRLTHSQGMKWYLAENNILCKKYQDHVKDISQKLKEAVLEPFLQHKLLVKHVYGREDKDQIARAFAAERGITEGDVCALSALEMAPTFQHYKTDMVIRSRPCPTIYLYRLDPEFGWMHARIQTWFPFYMHVCINGREWLSRRMDREGLRYFRQENCFPWVEDIPRAQPLFQEQLQVNWADLLQPFAQRLNPLHEEIFRNYPTEYYWSGFQCEWATDILFRPGTLARLSPLLLEHGMLSFSSPDVLQFLGHRINIDGQIPRNYRGELTTDFKSRASGDRVKYRIDGNSLKGYGKASTPLGDLFRVETLTQRPEVFKTYRPAEGGPDDDLKWRIMRRGVADMHRRCEVSQKANERYWDALSTVDLLCGPVDPNSPLSHQQKRRRSAAVSRKLRLLRAHGLIQKVPKTHRYQVTSHGRLAITAILTMDRTSIALLNKAAA